jgi:hypothetical protein
MKYVKMQAFPITEDTYSLAVALLPPVFATIPIDQTLGCWVVINQLGVRVNKVNQLEALFDLKEETQTLTLESSWMSEEVFHKVYECELTSTRVVLSDVTKIN